MRVASKARVSLVEAVREVDGVLQQALKEPNPVSENCAEHLEYKSSIGPIGVTFTS
jgi:hypothetical protein